MSIYENSEHRSIYLSNLNFYDESGFTEEELFKASEPFLTQNSDFKLGGSTDHSLSPRQFPNQRIYASSASTTDTYFFKLYRDFSQKMFLGDPNYFVADINSELVINGTFNGVTLSAPLLSQNVVDAAMNENKEKASREYSNIFTTEGADQQIIKRRMIIRNEELTPPVLANPGGKKYVIAIDPARSHDNSVMTIAEIYEDPDKGKMMKIVNSVTFADTKRKNKTPMRTPEQIREFKRALVDYNGKNVSDYENIAQVLLDDGAGGGGVGTWADNLLNDWVDTSGKKRKGIIDRNHKEYSELSENYLDSVDKLTLTKSKGRNEIFGALREMISHDYIKFPESYDGKGELVFLEEKNKNTADTKVYRLSDDEIMSLVNIDLAKEELFNIYEFATGSTIRYDLAPHQKHKMHDDRAYTIAMLAWYLQELRRGDVVKQEPDFDPSKFIGFKASGF